MYAGYCEQLQESNRLNSNELWHMKSRGANKSCIILKIKRFPALMYSNNTLSHVCVLHTFKASRFHSRY